MPELIVILIVILIIFGPKNLPKLGSALGKAVKGVREGVDSVNSELETTVESFDTTTAGSKNEAAAQETVSATAVVEDIPPAPAPAPVADAPAGGFSGEAVAVDEAVGFCSQCGAVLDADSKFCKKCGAPTS